MTRSTTVMLRLLALTLAFLASPAVTPASAQGISALSQAQRLSDAQKGEVASWMNERFDGLLSADASVASNAARQLIEPFLSGQATASFRFAAQDALRPAMNDRLDEGAPAVARYAALRLCGRIATTQVLPELESALASDNATERSLAVGAYADYFQTASEASSPIREAQLDSTLSRLRDGLTDEGNPAIAAQFVGVLSGAGLPESALRLRTTRAMAGGLVERFERGAPDENRIAWAAVLVRAIESANSTYVRAQFGGTEIGRDLAPEIGRLCAHGLAFASLAGEATDAGDRAVVAELAVRGATVFDLIHDGDIAYAEGSVQAFTEALREALEAGDTGTYTERVGVIVGARGVATGSPYNVPPIDR